MSKFRKPYLSIFLAMLILFVSCQAPTNTEISDENVFQKSQYTLQNLVADNLASMEIISNLMEAETTIDLDYLAYNTQSISSEQELRTLLLEAKIINIDDVVSVLLGVKENIEKFTKNNPSFLEMDEEKQIDIIVDEIELQLEEKGTSIFYPKSDCWDDRARAENICSRNWAISIGVSTIAGFFSFGWGTVVGYSGAFAQAAICLNDALNEFIQCQENNNQGQ